MSKPIANVDILTGSWESLTLKVNALLDAITNEVVTANSTYANTGTPSALRVAQIYGSLGANTLIVTNGIRGGNVSSSGTMNIVSNVAVSNVTFTSSANSIYSNTQLFNANVVANCGQISLSPNSGSHSLIANISGIYTISNTQYYMANSTVSAITVLANSTSTNTTFAGNTAYFSANVSLPTSILTLGNTTVNTVANSTSLSSINLNVSNTANIANINSSNTANLNILMVSNTSTFKTEYVLDVSSNTNIGSNSAGRVIYSFPKATYASGKFEVQIRNTGNTQLTELIVAHDNTTAYCTAYGTVSSPAAGNTTPLIATFTSQVNGANIEIVCQQTTFSNSATKIIAHLIKT